MWKGFTGWDKWYIFILLMRTSWHTLSCQSRWQQAADWYVGLAGILIALWRLREVVIFYLNFDSAISGLSRLAVFPCPLAFVSFAKPERMRNQFYKCYWTEHLSIQLGSCVLNLTKVLSLKMRKISELQTYKWPTFCSLYFIKLEASTEAAYAIGK
jgi:hypothetical protein